MSTCATIFRDLFSSFPRLSYSSHDVSYLSSVHSSLTVSPLIGDILYFKFPKLRSLKLGIVPGPTASLGSSQPLVYTIRNSADAPGFSWNDKRSRQGKESSCLTRSCLSSLSGDSDAPGYAFKENSVYLVFTVVKRGVGPCLIKSPEF